MFLAVLQDRVDRGQTEAERLLEQFAGPWGGRVDPVFEVCRL